MVGQPSYPWLEEVRTMGDKNPKRPPKPKKPKAPKNPAA